MVGHSPWRLRVAGSIRTSDTFFIFSPNSPAFLLLTQSKEEMLPLGPDIDTYQSLVLQVHSFTLRHLQISNAFHLFLSKRYPNDSQLSLAHITYCKTRRKKCCQSTNQSDLSTPESKTCFILPIVSGRLPSNFFLNSTDLANIWRRCREVKHSFLCLNKFNSRRSDLCLVFI